jgi:predicted metal-dependent hydrolase
MALTFELATFTVREGEEASLVAERPRMIAALGEAFPGVLGAWLAKRDDGSWIDLILWHSREEAEEAAKHVDGVPAAKAWFRHIAESHGLQHVEVAHEELFQFVRRSSGRVA